MRLSARGLIGPLVLGLIGAVLSQYIGWWSWLLVLGYAIGLTDDAPLLKPKRRSS